MLKKIIISLIIVVFAVAGVYAYRTHEAIRKVESYKTVVESVLTDDNLPNSDSDLVLAIIYQETKGGSTDVMQSSESVTGVTNTTPNSTASIRNGVLHLADMLAYADQKGTDVWTGVQAYNFGKSYVDYVAKRGGKNTLALAEAYSKDVVAPSLGNTSAKTYQHLTWAALFYNGGKLYTDGGNFFYANEVQGKLDLIKWFNW